MTAMAQPAEPPELTPTEPAQVEPGQDGPIAPSAELEPAPTEPGWSGSLPEVVRLRVVALASDALGALADDEVPASLRLFRRWAPARRTKLAATPLAAAIEHDVLFRQRCAARLREAMPDLAAALESGTLPAAADPIDVAAAAYLLRAPGWGARIAGAAEQLTQATEAAETAETVEMLARLQETLAAVREQSRQELTRAREDLAAAQARRGHNRQSAEQSRWRPALRTDLGGGNIRVNCPPMLTFRLVEGAAGADPKRNHTQQTSKRPEGSGVARLAKTKSPSRTPRLFPPC